MYKYIVFNLLVVSFIQLNAQVQELVSVGGDYFQTSQLNISWSLGEPVTETFTANGILLTQGFQQGIMDPVGIIGKVLISNVQVSVYPNPTNSKVFLMLTVENSSTICNYFYSIYTMQGQELIESELPEDGISLDFSKYDDGPYLLRVFNHQTTFQSTIIIQKLNL